MDTLIVMTMDAIIIFCLSLIAGQTPNDFPDEQEREDWNESGKYPKKVN